MKFTKTKVLVGSVTALAVAGGGAAIAATQLGSPKEESQAVIDDAAKQLGVQPSALSDALKKALANRVDAAVADGRITKAEGDRMKQRIEANEFPLFGFPHGGFGVDHMGPLHAAAQFLGLSDAELRTQLHGGKTLAQIAKDKGKSVDGLVAALIAPAKAKLDAQVAAGAITAAQEQTILSDLTERVTNLVKNVRPTMPATASTALAKLMKAALTHASVAH